MGYRDILSFTRQHLNRQGSYTLDQDGVRRISRSPTYRLTRNTANELSDLLTEHNRHWLFSAETFVHPQNFQEFVYLIGARSLAEWVTARHALQQKMMREWGGQAMEVLIPHPH